MCYAEPVYVKGSFTIGINIELFSYIVPSIICIKLCICLKHNFVHVIYTTIQAREVTAYNIW